MALDESKNTETPLEAPENPWFISSPLHPQPDEFSIIPGYPIVQVDKDGLLHGDGRCDLVRGHDYVGEFEHGFPQGLGTWRWYGEDRGGESEFKGFYHGEWRRGKPVRGTYQWENGDKYDGELGGDYSIRTKFCSNYHGQGEYTFANGDCYKGKWFNGSMAKGIYHLYKAGLFEFP